MASKQELRAVIRASRDEESQAVRRDRAMRLTEAAADLAPFLGAGIAGFQPTNNEPDICGLLRASARRGPVYLPRVIGTGLEWVRAGFDDLVARPSGIPRPPGPAVGLGAGIATDLHAGVILVPALAVDPRTGARLGYGAGFYDRLLARIRGLRAQPLVVGVCRQADLVDVAATAEAHDQPMDAVLTEAGLARIRGTTR